jgi:hypothetical protein
MELKALGPLLDRRAAMDEFSVAGPPCPFCGAHAFSWDAADPTQHDEAILEFGGAQMRYRPRICAECGNIEIVVTRESAPILPTA